MLKPNYVFVLDTRKIPLTPCLPSVASRLLDTGKAAVFRMFPFTIILKKEVDATPEPVELKIDPGSKTTGLAILLGAKVIFAAELTHRGQAISASLKSRAALRGGRRARHTRYRRPRLLKRTRPKGWLAPSLQHRVLPILTWVEKFRQFAPIGSIAQELVRFDLQQLENPEISGIEYQQGELAGYEVREYLLNKWDRKCAYCQKENIPLQIEHIHPKSQGGTNRISNLALACETCNTKKGTQDITTVRTVLNCQQQNAGFSLFNGANANDGMRVSASVPKTVRSIDITILRTELSGYNTVGEEIRIVWMGFNEGWVQV